jgi:hypothetical protein
MRFEERELKPYSEPVSPKELKIGVVLAAAVLFMGSVLILLAIVWMFTDAVESYRVAGQPLSGILNARLFAYAVLPFCFSLLGVIASVGLFGLREWARKTAIFLSVAPVTICGLLVLLQPNAIFQPDAGIKYAILTVGDLGIVVYVCMFVALIPVSVWWLILFTRESVRSQFRSQKTL